MIIIIVLKICMNFLIYFFSKQFIIKVHFFLKLELINRGDFFQMNRKMLFKFILKAEKNSLQIIGVFFFHFLKILFFSRFLYVFGSYAVHTL